MTNVHLTDGQQKEIINALLYGALPMMDHDYIQLIGYGPAAKLMNRDCHHIRFSISFDSKPYQYLLTIAYHDHGTGYNPETIALYRLGGEGGAEILHLHLIGYVTDLLREYGVW